MDQSKFKRIEVTSVRQQFEEELVNMILSGQLRTGEQLPTERQLAADMGICTRASGTWSAWAFWTI